MPLLLVTGEDDVTIPNAPVQSLAALVTDVIISLLSITILSSFMAQRYMVIRNWKKLPVVAWLVLAIFVDSWVFVFATAILKRGVNIDATVEACSFAILLCLLCYLTTKVLVYGFLIEKAFVVRNGTKTRLRSKLYLFNSFGILSLYATVTILNFVHRVNNIQHGVCIIGMRRAFMIPLLVFDAVVNIYLTVLFLIPLACLYSYKNMPHTPANMQLRAMVVRTFIGAALTTVSSVTNIAVLLALGGEAGWICLLCCNCDILFTAMVIHWVTSSDNAATASPMSSHRPPSIDLFHTGFSRGLGSKGGAGGGAGIGKGSAINIRRSVTRASRSIPDHIDMDLAMYGISLRPLHDAAYRSTDLLRADDLSSWKSAAGGRNINNYRRRRWSDVSDLSDIEGGNFIYDGSVGRVETVIVGGKDAGLSPPPPPVTMREGEVGQRGLIKLPPVATSLFGTKN